MINDKQSVNPNRRKLWISLGVMMSIVLLLGVMLSVMPKSFMMTHEEIGAGRPALVFVYDPNLQVSISQTEQMNEARDRLNDQALFLIAKINTPEGDKLIAEHNASIAELLLFDPTGKLAKRQLALKTADELINWLALDAN